MRQIKLINHNNNSTTILQWNEKTGELLGNAQLIAEIQQTAQLMIKLGYCNFAGTWDYPIQNPLKNALEFAVILSSMDIGSADLPLPEDDTDPYIRDEQGAIVGHVVF